MATCTAIEVEARTQAVAHALDFYEVFQAHLEECQLRGAAARDRPARPRGAAVDSGVAGDGLGQGDPSRSEQQNGDDRGDVSAGGWKESMTQAPAQCNRGLRRVCGSLSVRHVLLLRRKHRQRARTGKPGSASLVDWQNRFARIVGGQDQHVVGVSSTPRR